MLPRTSPASTDSGLSLRSSSKSTSDVSHGVGDHLRAAWNQIRFGWVLSVAPTFTRGVPIYFLGRRYMDIKDGDKRPIRCGPLDGDVDAFLQDFSSRLWFTYRGAFEPLPLPVSMHSDAQVGSPLTSTAEFRRSISLSEAPSIIPTTTTVCASWSAPSQHQKVQNGTANQSVSSPSPSRIPLSLRTSDAGWGCMLRSGQMLLAQALVVHFLGRNWIYSRQHNHPASHPSSWYHRQIIRWFGDTPAASSPLSIHRLVQASGSPPGACLGPATLCRALVIAMALAGQTEPLLREIEVYLARDRVICTEEVLDLFNNCPHPSPSSDGEGYSFTDHTGNYRPTDTNEPEIRHRPAENQRSPRLSITSASSIGSFLLVDPADVQSDVAHLTDGLDRRPRRGLLLLVPMRLGAGSRIDALYTSTFLHLLRDPACVGAVGGRPRHSVYMAGSQNDRLIYLDPHFYQETTSVEGRFFSRSSWHCSTPRLMPIKHLDPSCAFGFYCGSRMELVQLLERLPRISELRSPHRSNTRLIEVVSASQATYLFSPPITPLPTVNGSNLTKDRSPSYSYPPIDDSEQFDHKQHCKERDDVFI
ncbi:hypothetical protein AAHC03_09217 [Spirometra sp. Aus1]